MPKKRKSVHKRRTVRKGVPHKRKRKGVNRPARTQQRKRSRSKRK